jgi:hypothetical protein
VPKIVSLSPSTQAAAGLTPNRATIKDIEAALLRAPNFLASLGLSDEADLADLLKIPLGSGHYAYAFALPNGTVLKVTDDEDDARVCKMILEQGNGKPGLPFIQSVHRLPGTVYEHETDENEERPIFAIVMESVTPASRAFRGIRPRLLGEVVLYPSMEPELPSEAAREFVRVIRRGIHWLAARGVSVIDLHHNNFGYASGKRPVIIDFGHGSLRDDFEMTPVKMAANPSVSVESRAQAFKRLRASNNRCAAALKRIDTKLGVGDIMKALDLAESEEQFRQILDEYRSRMAKISPENAARREQIIREWEDTIDESIDRAEEVEEEPLRDIWRSLGSPRVDMNELRKGIKVEQEHTGDLREAGKIAMDHLREFPDYYTRLTKMEARAKAGLAPNPTDDHEDERRSDMLAALQGAPEFMAHLGINYQWLADKRNLLGAGDYALVYALPDRTRALKITDDPQDAARAKIVLDSGESVRGLVVVFDVAALPGRPFHKVWALVVERVRSSHRCHEQYGDEDASNWEWYGPDVASGAAWLSDRGHEVADLHDDNVGWSQGRQQCVIIDFGNGDLASPGPAVRVASNARKLAPNPKLMNNAHRAKADLVLMHGTSSASWAAIQRAGSLREPHLTDDEGLAAYYAQEAAENDGSRPMILRVSVPPSGLRYDGAAMDEPVQRDEEDVREALDQAGRKHPEWVDGGYVTVPESEWRLSLKIVGSVWFDGEVSLSSVQPTGLAPNRRTTMSQVQAAFDECFDALLEQFPDFGELELHEDEKAGGDNGHGSERQFGYCMDGKPIRVAFAAKTESLPVANIRGLMAHEFGHALDYRYGDKLGKMLGQRLPEGVERRADSIAKTVFGRTIKYDGRDIQCVACQGKSTRPRRLGP